MDQSARLSAFLDLASALTGVSQKVVAQAEAAAGYLANYTSFADAYAAKSATDAMLIMYSYARSTMPPDQAAAAMLGGTYDGRSPDPNWPFSAMARTLLSFVLLGIWFKPDDPTDEGDDCHRRALFGKPCLADCAGPSGWCQQAGLRTLGTSAAPSQKPDRIAPWQYPML